MLALNRLLLPLVLAGVGIYVLVLALRGDSFVLYFVSAVFLGMGIAAFQRARRDGGG